MARSTVRRKAGSGRSRPVRFAKSFGTWPSFAIASMTRGVRKEAATLMPNMETRAPRMMILLIRGFWKTAASTTTSFELTIATGSIIMETKTMPK